MGPRVRGVAAVSGARRWRRAGGLQRPCWVGAQPVPVVCRPVRRPPAGVLISKRAKSRLSEAPCHGLSSSSAGVTLSMRVPWPCGRETRTRTTRMRLFCLARRLGNKLLSCRLELTCRGAFEVASVPTALGAAEAAVLGGKIPQPEGVRRPGRLVGRTLEDEIRRIHVTSNV